MKHFLQNTSLICILNLISIISKSQVVVDFESNKTSGCIPLNVIFKNTSPSKSNYTFQWLLDENQSSNNPDSASAFYSYNGTKTITLQAFDKQGNKVGEKTKKNLITVFRNPVVSISKSETVVCKGSIITFTPNIISSDAPIKSWIWEFSDGVFDTAKAPIHLFDNIKDSAVQLLVFDTNQCSNGEKRARLPIIVQEHVPFSYFEFKQSDATCDSTTTIDLVNNSSYNYGTITNYLWTFPDGKTSKEQIPPSQFIARTGNTSTELKHFSLVVTSDNGCKMTCNREFVFYNFQPGIQITDSIKPTVLLQKLDTLACPGTKITVTATGNDVTSVDWDLNNANTFTFSSKPTTSFYAPKNVSKETIYTVKLRANSPVCTKEVIATFKIEPNIVYQITPLDSFYCSSPHWVQFKVTNSNISTKRVEWYMDSLSIDYKSDTTFLPLKTYDTTVSTEASKKHLVIKNYSYDMRVDITTNNSCFSSKLFPKNIMVYEPKPRFNETPSQGCVPLDVTFENQSTYIVPQGKDYIDSIYWNLGDGSTVLKKLPNQTVSYQYTKEGIFKTKMLVHTKRGCTIADLGSVQTGTKQIVKFRLKDTVACALKGAVYLDSSTDTLKVDVVDVSFFKKDYVNNVTMSTYIIASLQSKPDTDITINPHTPVSVSFKTYIPNSSIPAYMQQGMYDMNVTVFYNGCPSESEYRKDAIRIAGPWAYINGIKQDCNNPYSISLNVDTLRDATNWMWKIYKFDKKAYELVDTLYPPDAPQPNYSFKVDSLKYGTGHFKARLIAINNSVTGIAEGCRDSAEVIYAVTDTHMDFSLQDKHSCTDSLKWISFEPLKDKLLIKNISWTVKAPDGTVDNVDEAKLHNHQYLGSNLYNPIDNYYNYPAMYPSNIFPYDTLKLKQEGNYIITATAIDINECLNTKIDTIKVYSPHADFTKDDVKDCIPFKQIYIDKSKFEAPIVEWKWIMPGAMKKDGQSADYDTIVTIKKTNAADTATYNKKQYFTAILQITDSLGCIGKIEKQNYVSPIVPSAKFLIPKTKVCLGHEITFARDLSPDTLYNTSIDSMKWSIANLPSFTLHKNDADFNMFTKIFNQESINEKIYTTAYITTKSGSVCTNSDSLTTLEVKDATAANPKLVNDTVNCYVGRLQMNSTQAKNYSSIEWSEIYKSASGADSVTFKGVLAKPDIMISNVGVHRFRLHTLSPYYGCEDQFADITYNIDRSDFRIIVDTTEVCINKKIHFNLDKDSLNILPHKFCWYFGDGEKDSINIATSHAYNRVFEKGAPRVIFAVENSCHNFDSVLIKVRKVMANFNRGFNDTILKGCPPITVPFINTSESDGTVSYLWDFGDGTFDSNKETTHTFNHADTTYKIRLYVKGEICDDDSIKTIKILRSADITSSYKSTICEDSVLTIRLQPTIDGTVVSNWMPNPSIVSLDSMNLKAITKPDATTDFIINTRNDNNGEYTCSVIDTIKVKVQQRPQYNGAPKNHLVYLPNDTLFFKPSDQLYAYVKYSLNNDSLPSISYRWQPFEGLSCDSCANPDIMISKEMNYTVTMTDTLGCFSISENINFKTILETVLGLPTAFTPNEDGNNDFVVPRGWGIKEFISMQIFNRWGQMVFETNDITKGWNGMFNGRPQDSDTFAWQVKYIDYKELNKTQKGFITLLRK